MLIFNHGALLTMLVNVRQLLVIYGSSQGIHKLQGELIIKPTAEEANKLFKATRMQHTTWKQQALARRRRGGFSPKSGSDGDLGRPLGPVPDITATLPRSRVSVSSHRVAARQRRG